MILNLTKDQTRRAVKVLLLLVVRDPVTRLISDYAQILENHRKRNLEYKSFEEAAFHGNSGTPNRNYDAIQKARSQSLKKVEYCTKILWFDSTLIPSFSMQSDECALSHIMG